MNEIMKLVSNLGDTYEIGQKILGYQFEVTKRHLVKEAAKVMSSVMSLLLIAVAGAAFMIFGFLLIGLMAAEYWDQSWMIYGIPAMLCFVMTIYFWKQRQRIFISLTSNVMRDVLL